MIKYTFCVVVLSLTLIFGCRSKLDDNKPMNILMFTIDDLRPELNCYGIGHIHSPNIDKLAAQGFLFTQAYCQTPVCGASRASFFTGLKPVQDRFLKWNARIDHDTPDAVTIPLYFKEQGYKSISYGKNFHDHFDEIDSENHWSETPWESYPCHNYYVLPENQKFNTMGDNLPYWGDYGPAYEIADVPDNAYPTGKTADKAVEALKNFKKTGEPFFLAVGFRKPHDPFNAPQKYWDLYDRDKIKLAPNPYVPENVPNEGVHNYPWFRLYTSISQEGHIDDSLAIILRHGYYACVSYVDAQVGKVMNELKAQGLDKNTIVVLWGDHGWMLGEHNMWTKHLTYQIATKAPLLISIPNLIGGKRINGLTEMIDVFPTLCELLGYKVPSQLEGESLASRMKNPSLPGKSYAFTRYGRGENVVTEKFSYTEYYDKEGKMKSNMLYNLETDSLENVNVADQEEYSGVRKELSAVLRKQFKRNRVN